MGRKGWSAVLEEPNKIVLKQFELPEIGPDEGLLKMEMCVVCGTDPKVYHGEFDWIKYPMILGHEVGEIAANNEIRFQGVFTNDHPATRAAIKLVESGKYPVDEIISHRYSLPQAEEAVKAGSGEIPGFHPLRVAIVP